MPRRNGRREAAAERREAAAARRESAATAAKVEEHVRTKRGPKWGNLVVALLALALMSYAAYNEGLLDGILARIGQVEEPVIFLRDPIVAVPALAPMETALGARALYLTMDTAGTPSRMAAVLEYVRGHEGLNSFVIDIKDNSGRVPAKPPENVPSRPGGYGHLPALVRVLADDGYYMIARVVAFQDPYRANAAPENAIRYPDGSLWRDRDGRLWLNPYDERNWEFVRDVALWAVDMGFHEIQLDYVRFPDSAQGLERSGAVLMPGAEKYETRGDCIAAFLKYMSQALEDKAYLSADIFGFATIAVDDMGIGHKWEQLADSVDFMCPMVYPSHYYNAGIYGFQVPEAHPYEVVYKAMAEALERGEGLRAKVRPWLQDFSYRMHYGPDEVEGQIRAVFESGIETYLLWNPGNVYTDGVEYVIEGASVSPQ